MAKLSSAIVQRKLATLRDVEEALARQVLYGGDLATNLLEQAPGMDERALTALLAETQGLPPAPAGPLPRSPSDALALIPGDLALRHGVYPLEKSGGKLVVAVSEPMKPDVEQDLAFSLGVTVVQRVAPLVRVKEAICRDYGLPLDRRSHRVLAKLEGRPDPSPSLTPPPLTGVPDIGSLPRPPSIPPLGLPAPTELSPGYLVPDIANIPALRPLPQVLIRDPDPETPNTGRAGVSIHERLTFPAPPEAAPTGLAPTPTLRAEASSLPLPPVRIIPDSPVPQISTERRTRTSSLPPGSVPPQSPTDRRARTSSPPPGSVPPPSRRSSPPGKMSVQRADLGVWGAESKLADRRSKTRHRGPYTAAAAEEDLLNADSRDTVLTALFDFACQYFEYAALFAVHGDLAEGRSANGPGADHAKITGIGVPLDMPGALATARKEGHFSIQSLAKDGLDAQLAKDLERTRGKKALLLPILVRGRCVLIFYGDDGDHDVDLSLIGDVLAFAPLVASALENVIRKKKASLRQGAGLPPSASVGPAPRPRVFLPSRDERREALAAALETTLRHASSRPPSRTSRPPPVPARTRSVPPGSVRTRSEPSRALDDAARPGPLGVLDEAIRNEWAHALDDTVRQESLPGIPSPRAEPAAAPSKAPEPAANDTTAASAVAPPREESDESDEPDRPSTNPAIPAMRVNSVQAPRPVDPRRAYTPAQGTPALGSVPPPQPPGMAFDRGLLSPSIEEGPPVSLDDYAESVDSGPELSFGTAELEPSPELAQSIQVRPPMLPDSQVVVPAKRPLKAHSSEELRLPSIIVNVDQDIEGLVRRLLEGDDKVIEKLAVLGASAASYLVSRFPGPIREADRLGTPEPASLRGPILRALARIGLPAAPFLAVRSNDRDPSVRAWATALLGEIPSIDSATAVSRRVTDATAEVRRSALEAGKLLQTDDDARTTLRDKVLSIAESTSPVESRVAAMEALAHFRDGRAVPRLVRLLANNDEVSQSAEWALGVLTRQGFGRDTAAWDAWWKEKGGQHRIEWLVDSLTHDDAEIRRAAGEELKSLTKEYFGYYDDLPKAERAKAQRRYREWWQATGKAKFPK
ncbi:MAG TPA: hypothetical protein VH062_04120 [Polyangiaceae bacterium]|jgi:hypothetical protein|nr:hypothetical protein [Polyangiaceae bacterium]